MACHLKLSPRRMMDCRTIAFRTHAHFYAVMASRASVGVKLLRNLKSGSFMQEEIEGLESTWRDPQLHKPEYNHGNSSLMLVFEAHETTAPFRQTRFLFTICSKKLHTHTTVTIAKHSIERLQANVCKCSCMYTQLFICEYVNIDIHVYIHIYMHVSCIDTCRRARTHKIHTYIHACIHTYIPTYLHTYIPTYLRTYIHTYIFAYIQTYIRTYIHAYIFSFAQIRV